MSSLAIMQPTYLPWIGYFALLDRVDAFVFLDSVQFARRSWQQRNRIKTAQGELMLTVPVASKGRRDQTIAEVEIERSGEPLTCHRRSIEAAYRKAPHYGRHAEGLFAILERGHRSLAELNIELIGWLARAFGITTPTQRSSSMAVAGAKAELLAEICSVMGAAHYVSPPGSRAYLDESDALTRRGIRLSYLTYGCTPYRQLHGAFVPYLSAIDLLFNEGEDSLQIIRGGGVLSEEP